MSIPQSAPGRRQFLPGPGPRRAGTFAITLLLILALAALEPLSALPSPAGPPGTSSPVLAPYLQTVLRHTTLADFQSGDGDGGVLLTEAGDGEVALAYQSSGLGGWESLTALPATKFGPEAGSATSQSPSGAKAAAP